MDTVKTVNVSDSALVDVDEDQRSLEEKTL
jgi:hypothetical protein